MDIKRLKEMAGLAESSERFDAKDTVIQTTAEAHGLTEMDRLRQLAGLPLVESYGDDDDEGLSRSERELAKMADRDLKKKGIKVDNVDPEKDLESLAAAKRKKQEAAAAKKEEPKAEPKAEAEPEKKEPSSAKIADIVRAALKAGGNASDVRAAFTKAGLAVPNHLHSHIGRIKKSLAKPALKECFVIRHPSVTSFVLAENPQFNRYQWIVEGEGNEHIHELVFETVDQAEEIIQHIEDYKSMSGIVSRVDLTEQ